MATVAFRQRLPFDQVQGWIEDAKQPTHPGPFARLALKRAIIENRVDPMVVPRELWPTEADLARVRDGQAWQSRRDEKAKRALQGAGA